MVRQHKRKVIGEYHRLFPSLREHPKSFENYTRMTIPTFDYILSRVKNRLQKKRINFHKEPIREEEQLIITIRFLATGLSYADLGHSFAMAKSKVCVLVGEVLQALWITLQPIHLPMPTSDTLIDAAQDFYLLSDLPQCVGALDVCHVRVRKPPHSGSRYYNFKRYYSMTLQGLVDAHRRFLSVDIGGYGSQHDSITFHSSHLYRRFLSGSLKFPEDDQLYDSEIVAPYFIVGDGAYPLSRHLLKPYLGRNLSEEKKLFNLRLSRARITVERSFGALHAKWKIFRKPLGKSDKIGRDLLSQYTGIQDEMVQNEISIVALQLLMLPHLIPSTNSRKLSKTETWKVSVGDSKQIIIQFAIDSTLIPDLLGKRKEFAEKHKVSVQPSIFVVGEDLKNIKESYIIFDSISYKIPSTLEAFKVCFKLFHVLLLKYPFESEHLYILIQKLLKIKTQWDDKIFPCTEHLHTVQKKLEDFPFPDLL
uniref:DDE Tnp4 domain-containing protein n=1 Tax=Trichogramma kaykai TaxID=54128 RepID=A0ABD2WDW9_9HYME